MKYTALSFASFLASLVAGCSQGSDVNIGEGTPETLGSALSHYEGEWDGYTEAFQFSDGSDRFRLTLDAEGQGTVVFGDAPALPPATDPNVGYPPGNPDSLLPVIPEAFVPGVTYDVVGATVESDRIRFKLNALELYEDWCALQMPMPNSSGGYGCLPPSAGFFSTDDGCFLSLIDETVQSFDCGKITLCLAPGLPCSCTATECKAEALSIVFDAAFSANGKDLVGTLTANPDVPSGGRITTRLSK